MNLNENFHCDVSSISYKKVKIVDSDPKEYELVAVVKITSPFFDGDLDCLIPSDAAITNSSDYSKVTFPEQIGDYSLVVNDVNLEGSILRIDRVNNQKNGERFFSIYFLTSNIGDAGTLSHYLKQEDSPNMAMLSRKM